MTILPVVNINGSILDGIRADLSERMVSGMYRIRRVINTAQGPTVNIDGRDLINFSSNDYLGLAKHPDLQRIFKQAVDIYGLGAGSSHLVCGHSSAHAELEEELADFTGRQRALVFSSGYLANLAVVTALAGKDDIVIGDRLDHASMIDAARLSQARLRRYRHADAGAAEQLIKTQVAARKLVLTDGVFSMDGDVAPLIALAQICQTHNAMLIVDDAHGFGVLGKRGGGVLDLLGLGSRDVPVLVGTFGKALGAFGAFVSGDGPVIELLIQKARSYIYTTALPPAIAATVKHALGLVRSESWRRDHLACLIRRFCDGASQLGLSIKPSTTAIQPLIIGEADEAVRISERLYQKGILIPAIRPPTVPKGSSRLRISLSAAHDEAQVDYLLETLDAVL